MRKADPIAVTKAAHQQGVQELKDHLRRVHETKAAIRKGASMKVKIIPKRMAKKI